MPASWKTRVKTVDFLTVMEGDFCSARCYFFFTRFFVVTCQLQPVTATTAAMTCACHQHRWRITVHLCVCVYVQTSCRVSISLAGGKRQWWQLTPESWSLTLTNFTLIAFVRAAVNSDHTHTHTYSCLQWTWSFGFKSRIVLELTCASQTTKKAKQKSKYNKWYSYKLSICILYKHRRYLNAIKPHTNALAHRYGCW